MHIDISLTINLSSPLLVLTHISSNKYLICSIAKTNGFFSIIMTIAFLWVNIGPAQCLAHCKYLISRETLFPWLSEQKTYIVSPLKCQNFSLFPASVCKTSLKSHLYQLWDMVKSFLPIPFLLLGKKAAFLSFQRN